MSPADLADLERSFRLHLRATNKSPKTITGYCYAVSLLTAFPRNDGESERRWLERFFAERLTTYRPASVSVWYRALQAFFKWAAEEDEIPENPMLGMKPPKVPEVPPPVLTPDQLRAILRVTSGTDFRARRDHAILRLFMDTGCREAELAGMLVEGVDLNRREVPVLGKGRRPRVLPFGTRTEEALDRYLRSRRRHRLHKLPQLWIGHAGAMTPQGIYQAVRARGEEAGVKLYPHLLRHTFAHEWLLNEGSETNLQNLAGWQSPQMLRRYGASAASERAREAHRKLALGDRY